MSRMRLWWDWLDVFTRLFVAGSDYLMIPRFNVRASAATATVIYRVLRDLRGSR